MSEANGFNNIASLIADLASRDRQTRLQAREALITIGQPVVSPLLTALTDPNDQVRWEAVKILGKTGGPATLPLLVTALEDDNPGVRWAASEELITAKQAGLAPLLRALIKHANSVRLREAAYHVLHSLADATQDLEDLVLPVLTALENIEPAMTVPLAASNVLKRLVYEEKN